MHQQTVLLMFSLSLLITASPLNTQKPSSLKRSNPSPTLSPSSPKASAALDHEIATLIASDASASASFDPTTCPPSHESKQCCTSVTELADDVIGENGLGDVLPWLEGVQISSLVGFQCMSMGAKEGNENCLDSVMCCSKSEGNPNPSESGEQSLFKSGCVPYDKAIAGKTEEIEESHGEADYLASSSSAPSASAMPVMGRA
ncbi:hypothetical protein BDV06DRAFT_228289 [Aspergillus oleicola]